MTTSQTEQAMLYSVHSKKSLDEIEAALNEAVAKQKFGIMTVHDLQATMQKKGVEFAKECRIYEVCNPHQAKKVLEANGAVSTALPCRISVYEEGDGYQVATILPSELMKVFGSPELEPVAKEVEVAVKAIIDDAA